MAYRNLPEDKILGITVVAGNVPLEQGLINTSYVNELCEVQIPIYKGAEKPLERNYIEVHDSDESTKIALSYGNDSTSAQNVHGVDGLGDIGIKPQNHKIENSSAQDFYKQILEEIKHCYIMGGSSNALGNITKFAEYNFWVDPEAADIVLNSGIPITVIGWDPSLYDAMIDTEKIQEIESIGTKYSKFTNDIQVVLREMMKDIFGSDSYDLPDPLAMSVYLDNEIISQSAEVNVRVDTRDGMTRGGCVLDYLNLEPDAQKVRVVQRCHGDKFYNLLKQSLA
jgi:purine nucleosidase